MRGAQLLLSCAAEAARAASGSVEVGDDIELNLQHGDDDHLRNSLQRLNREFGMATIPDGDEDLPLVIGVDEPDKIAKHDAVLVAKAGARQHHCRISWITKVNRNSGRHQGGFTGFNVTAASMHARKSSPAEPGVA